MLLELSLKNFAIIDELSVRFGEGLNIITGETGTGKSIIVSAVNVLLGSKGSSDYVKTGADEAHIEALFSVGDSPKVRETLEAQGIPLEEDAVLIKRVISRKGRARAYINGSLATASTLSGVAAGLMDIFSQHEHQSLLKEENHLKILDLFAGNDAAVERLGALYREWKELEEGLRGLREDRARGVEREDYLRFLAEEIDRVRPEPGEDARLSGERERLSNAQLLKETAERAYASLYEEAGSVVDRLQNVLLELEGARKHDRGLGSVIAPLEGALHELEEVSYGLRDYASRVVVDGDGLMAVESRLEEINRLKRKHSATIEEIIEKREGIEGELSGILNYDERMEALEARAGAKRAELEDAASALGRSRRAAAGGLMERVNEELEKVGLKNAHFLVGFEERPITAAGAERVSFMFTANPDHDHKPLVKIASGGELSRTMLVLKEVASRVEGSSVLIFDEADSGIGGAVAETVGRKIKNLSKRYQVISITHLPQVAKFADTHIRVTKSFNGRKTSVSVTELGRDERVKELARMLGGIRVTEKTLEAAKEMLGR